MACQLATLLAVACAPPPPPSEAVLPAPPLPPVAGSLELDGLSAPVHVVRDRWGIPHITARTQHDLFFAQGFVQAQDRLFQMDLWRRSAQGRLSEVLGANFIERDAMTRRIQYRGPLADEWASYGPDAKAIADAFTQGVNAWIAIAAGRLPEEFALAGWTPEPWRAEDLLSRTEAFVGSHGADAELLRARLAREVGVAAAHRLLPHAGPPGAPSPTAIDLAAVSPLVGDMLRRVGAPPFFAGLSGPVVGRLRPDVPAADVLPLAGPPLAAQGSAWGVAPSRTSTGAPLVASLALAPLDHPSARYLVHLKAPGWNVIGVTAPWRPGVVAGHNDTIAWSFVPTSADTQDVVVERLNPSNARERWTPSGWRPLAVATEAVAVKGRDEPFESEQQFTPDGSVVATDRERHLAYAVSWVGREAGTAAELGALRVGRSTSWTAFRDALTHWKLPAAEFVYADVEGRIGQHAAGLIPVRPRGEGSLPAAGWTSRRRWRGFVPPDRLPSVLDPPAGHVVVSPGAARRGRLETLLMEPAIDVEAAARIQRDVVSPGAGRLIPLLARMTAADAGVEAARHRLVTWDRQVTARSVDAALFASWQATLLSALARTRIPAPLVGEVVPCVASDLVDAVVEASATWFDGDRPAARDRLLLDALAAAVDDLRERTGSSDAMPWARFRTAVFAHPLGLSDRARRRFDLGPFELSGDADTVAATSRISGRMMAPAVRLVLDLADWDRSRAIIVPGQSAAPDSPHFADLAGIWARGDDVPLVFSERAVAEAAQATLALVPRQ